jgi:hypothetical protein
MEKTMIFHIHLWGVNQISEKHFDLLKKFKVTNISIWKKKEKDFYKKCKDYGFKVTSLFPCVLDNYNFKNVFTDTNQVSFGNEKDFEEKVLEDISGYDDLIDEYIITDIPWYLMIKDSKVTDGSEFHFNPFSDTSSKKILEDSNIFLPNMINVFNKKQVEDWLVNQEFIFNKFMTRFDFLKEVNKKFIMPISFRSDKSFNCANIYSGKVLENYIIYFNSDILLMNATKEGIKWCNDIKNKHKVKILGGVEGALGLVNGNGLKLKNNNFDGIIANEHHFFNNRHPRTSEIEKAIYDLYQ